MFDAILYIHPDHSMPPLHLMNQLKKILPDNCKQEERINALYTSEFSIRLFENKNRSKTANSLEFPDGYFNFRYFLEFTSEEGTKIESSAETLILITEHLWSLNIPCVVESEYDELLPHSGGYNNPELPWPKR